MPPNLPSPNFERDIGALQATLAMVIDGMKDQAALHDRQMRSQQEQFSSIVAELKSMVSDANKQIEELGKEITAMKSLIDQAKGGWKILVGVGTISATIGAVIAKIISFSWNLPIK
jgi:archaellum component FlaC